MTTKGAILRVIKLQCQECMGNDHARLGVSLTGKVAEDVRGCTAPDCTLYPFRMGKDPWPAKKGNSEALKKARSASAVRAQNGQVGGVKSKMNTQVRVRGKKSIQDPISKG